MKRLTSVAAALAVAALALTGCASSAPESDSGSPSAPASDGAFPVTVDTKFGEVTIAEQPQRIVALGWGDAETVLALGFQPVGASDWLGFGGEGVGPWAEGLYDQAPVIIETLEPDYEAIANLRPDLILDTKSSGDEERYERLSQITTTVGVPEGGDSYLTSSAEQLELIAAALGVPDRGKELEADVDTAIEEAVEAHPDWSGKSVTVATRTSEGWGAYLEGDGRVDFLQSLGFAQSDKIQALEASANGFAASVSAEQLDLLDADLIVAFPIWIDTAEITDDPQWQAIPAVADGRAVVIDGSISDAFSTGTPLARLYAIESIVPLVESALGT